MIISPTGVPSYVNETCAFVACRKMSAMPSSSREKLGQITKVSLNEFEPPIVDLHNVIEEPKLSQS